MKRKIFIFTILIFIFHWSNAQIKGVRKQIDSIAQSRWNKTLLNLDSLANPSIEEISKIKMDSIVVNEGGLAVHSHEEIPVTPFRLIRQEGEKRWFFFGQNTVTFNQASFSNWNAGGNDNIGIIAKVNYNLSYKKDRHYLENLIQLGYGLVAAKGQSTRKTEDYINIATNYGYEIGDNFYLSTGYQFLSQFTYGYNYAATPDPQKSDRVSRFMAPGYLNAGLGISYNPKENFQVIFRPANGKFTFVLDPHLQKAGRYGLEHDGQSIRSELGAMLNVLYRLKLYENIFVTNQLNFFSNYINHPERVDINYSGTLNMKFNKLITAVLSLDLLYDHDQVTNLQRKQTLGVGLVYNIGADNKPKPQSKRAIKPFVN
ncbi:DUF3078 domain-containing protein [Bergeyella porcorum]|uniref:DUF3078 domain-containing protein n=1 Tax=Bergeyella porcorum TaxID=1735111 RepID=UPI0035EF39B8